MQQDVHGGGQEALVGVRRDPVRLLMNPLAGRSQHLVWEPFGFCGTPLS